MRFLLALLAVLGLLASPVSAAAAQLACSQMTASMSSASMSGAEASGTHQDGVMKAGDSCCDHHGKGCPEKSCAQLCAAACAVSDALAAPVVSVPFIMTAAEHALAPVATVHPFEPAGAERPPRAIA